jgi:hypothetical protein
MSDEDLEIETVTEDPEPERSYYVDLIELPELRRYVCLDLARMCGPLPEKTVDLAKKMEAFLLNKGPKAVE